MLQELKLVAAAGLLWAGTAYACDDHHGTCEIEDWRWYAQRLGSVYFLMIEGAATCDRGRISMRLYDAAGGEPKFLGAAEALVEGHAFMAAGRNIEAPETLSIKYSIQQIASRSAQPRKVQPVQLWD